MAAIQATLHHQPGAGQLTCRHLLVLSPSDVPYLPFDPILSGYPFFNPVT